MRVVTSIDLTGSARSEQHGGARVDGFERVDKHAGIIAGELPVVSVELQRALPADHPRRHPDGHNLADLVDIAIDCKVPMGDALLDVPGITQRVGASSTFLNAIALNLVTLHAIEKLAHQGINPPNWQSANSPGGDEANRQHVAEFKLRIKKL